MAMIGDDDQRVAVVSVVDQVESEIVDWIQIHSRSDQRTCLH